VGLKKKVAFEDAGFINSHLKLGSLFLLYLLSFDFFLTLFLTLVELTLHLGLFPTNAFRLLDLIEVIQNDSVEFWCLAFLSPLIPFLI
jgi:hypothetical protein